MSFNWKETVIIFPMMSDVISTAEAAQLLETTPPTIRVLIDRGELRGTQVPRGSRFSWAIERSSVVSYLRDNGPYQGKRSLSFRESLECRVADLESALLKERGLGANSPREVDDLRAQLTSMRDALAKMRDVSEIQRQAESERATAMKHLLAAVDSSERADELRRTAVAEMEDALTASTQPGHAGDLP